MNTPATTQSERTHRLIDELERLPTEHEAAIRVLWIADDANSSSETLANVVSTEPALTARIMRMANSAYYGLSGRVPSCAFAVTVLGFTTVRSLAAASAAGALESDDTLPTGFWLHGATVATAAAIVATRVGARHTEAFSVGLLHDLGRVLLQRSDLAEQPAPFDPAVECASLLHEEKETYGMTHADAAARVLAAWRFPADFTDAIATHHAPLESISTPLARALVGGEALARVALAGSDPGDTADHLHDAREQVAAEDAAALELVRISPDAVHALAAQVQQGGQTLAASMRSDPVPSRS